MDANPEALKHEVPTTEPTAQDSPVLLTCAYNFDIGIELTHSNQDPNWVSTTISPRLGLIPGARLHLSEEGTLFLFKPNIGWRVLFSLPRDLHMMHKTSDTSLVLCFCTGKPCKIRIDRVRGVSYEKYLQMRANSP